MKIETNKTPEFTPVSITFTFESQKELDAFGKLFNYAPLIEALKDIGASDVDEINEDMLAIGASIRPLSEFEEALKKQMHF